MIVRPAVAAVVVLMLVGVGAASERTTAVTTAEPASIDARVILAPWLAVVGGKLETLDGDANAFAGGRGKTQFSNLAFVLNPAKIDL